MPRRTPTLWRKANGRLTHTGDLWAVTAATSDGRIWTVTGDNPILKSARQLPVATKSARRPDQ